MTQKFIRRPKARNNYRNTELLCPECGSLLKYNKDFTKFCTGDRLKQWTKMFKEYEQGSKAEQMDMLDNHIDNKDLFLEWFKKWQVKDANGKRVKIECSYSNRLFDAHKDNSVLIPDPMMLARIEKDLGKKINTQALHEDTLFYHDGTKYLEKPTDKTRVIRLEWIRYPDDV